jgi:hypothetical protein
MMTDDDYFITDTESVAPEIDTAELQTDVDSSDDSDGSDDLNWKRPFIYLILVILLITVVSIALWLGAGSGLIT